MNRVIPLISMGFLIMMIVSAPFLVSGKSLDLTVVYSNNINGHIQPCPT